MRDDRTNSADPPRQRDDVGAELRRRREEIMVRIEQLRHRCQELADRAPHGSTADELATAQAHALWARRCAWRAHLRAAQRHDQAADAHLRLAVLYQRQENSERAQAHREAASADRARASEDMRAAQDEKRSRPKD
jgi:hypothetical protein